jgi:hypothetical protein
VSNYLTSSDVQDLDVAELYTLPSEADILEADIESAEAEVDAAAGVRYQVPISAAAPAKFLRRLTFAIFQHTAYLLHGQGSEIPEKVQKAADVAREQLSRIASGELVLSGAAGDSSGAAGAIIVSGDDPQFTRDHMKDF